MLSAVTQAGIVAVGRLEEARRLGVHISPFGVIPKKNKPNEWRLILDLSSPQGSSVNDGISKELCSLSYVSVDDVVNKIVTYQASIQTSTSVPTRSATAGNVMERNGVCG